MNAKEELTISYPNTPNVSELVELDEDSFNTQKLKHEERNAEGGAIGVVWLDDHSVVLASRTKLHPGWALIGGTVEQGQSFEDAFIREVKEEAGLDIQINRLALLVQKVFVSPSNEELNMDLAVFEATANAGQQVQSTLEAESEGLEVRAFNINDLPASMIMKDREKLEDVIAARYRLAN